MKELDYLKKIIEHGFKAYIVGGYPIDITTQATPKQLKQIFLNTNLVITNYSIVIKDKTNTYEITTMRKEKKYNQKRQPIKIKFIKNLKKDLKRRDFYINTLCIDKDGNFLDLLKAKKDRDRKVIRLIGKSKRLKEDPQRILRAVRLATTLSFNIDKKLSKNIKKYAYLVKNLSYTRKKEELDKIFSDKNAKKGIELIKYYHLDKYLELNNIDNVIITTDILGIWSQLGVIKIYPFKKEEKKIIEQINKNRDVDINN